MDNHNALEQAWLNGYKQGRQSVEKCGAIDVAIVVRCEDCQYWVVNRGSNYCASHDGLFSHTKPDDFCSYGERKTDD